jgi:cell division protein FtsL
MSNVAPIRKESQHPALNSMRLKIDNLEQAIAEQQRQLEFLKKEIKKLHA